MLFVFIRDIFSFFPFKLVSAKIACTKLESELKQEKGNGQDLRKMLADERNVMSTMDVEHQQQLVELEQRHEEKVRIAVTPRLHDISDTSELTQSALSIHALCRSFTSLTSYRANL